MSAFSFGPRMFALALAISSIPAGAFALEPGDAAAGAKVFKKCAACHSTEADAGNKIGPNLHGIVGRKSASVADFNYSAAMKDSGLTWDEGTIESYLRDPKGFIPKNKMAFAGLKKDSDLANVIAYLKEASK